MHKGWAYQECVLSTTWNVSNILGKVVEKGVTATVECDLQSI